ncbi:DUF1799 domain-containing protein [Sphingobium rhizovicinum]|uniref:DUF1799 domain-containing protein n=1 Tax=Sphingobium rhizovicinum TaxID=432308 RepID=A0ABV7NHM1_9SPHN
MERQCARPAVRPALRPQGAGAGLFRSGVRCPVGKLKAAARHWAGGGQPDLTEAAADAEGWGIPAELIDDLKTEEPGFPVWPQNMPIVTAFLAISNQWDVIPMASGQMYFQGLDYSRVRAGLKQARIKLNPVQWDWLRVMENAAGAALNGYRG